MLSSRAVDGDQMYFRGSVVGKASTIGLEIAPTPNFHGVQKVRNLASFKHHSSWAARLRKCNKISKIL